MKSAATNKKNNPGAAPSALKGAALRKCARQLGGGWKIIQRHHLEKNFKFPDFRRALDFTNRVGKLAERQNHHPDIYLAWGAVRLQMWTHTVDGLTENDFCLADQINKISPARR